MAAPAFVAFVNGVYGVGKTTVLDLVGDALAAAERPFSLFDVDWFHRSWPSARHDPENTVIEAANMRAVWHNYRRLGDRQPIVSGVLETGADTSRFERVFDLPVRSVLLTASHEAVSERLDARYGHGRPAALAWHLDRYREAARRIEAGGQYEAIIDTDGLQPGQVAWRVVAQLDLLR